jgi:hypothetical protein
MPMDTEDLKAFEQDTAKLVPGFQVKWKTGNLGQKLISYLLCLFNDEYMLKYTSTFYPHVYFPTKEYYESNPEISFTILAHERVHLLDMKKHGLWFKVTYLFPQIMSIPCLFLGALATLVSWWVAGFLFFVGLVFIASWPAPWRVKWEKRGYAMSLAVAYWMTEEISSANKAFIRNQFLDWGYYRMSWNRKDIDSWLDLTERSIRDGTLEQDPAYGDVHQFLKSRGETEV